MPKTNGETKEFSQLLLEEPEQMPTISISGPGLDVTMQLNDFAAVKAARGFLDMMAERLNINSKQAAIESAPSPATVSTRPNSEKIVSLGKKKYTGKSGTQTDKILKLFMKVEAEQGVHTVTRAALGDAARKAKFPASLINSGISTTIGNGFLSYD